MEKQLKSTERNGFSNINSSKIGGHEAFKDICMVATKTFLLSFAFPATFPVFDVSASSMLEAGHPRLVLLDNSEGRGGSGGFRMRQHTLPMADSCRMYGKTTRVL